MEQDPRRNGALKGINAWTHLGWNSTCFIEDLCQESSSIYLREYKEKHNLDTSSVRFSEDGNGWIGFLVSAVFEKLGQFSCSLVFIMA